MNNTRLHHLLVLVTASLVIAAACFLLGGDLAEAASATPIMGVTFKAGGALAGFVISFGALFLAYRMIGATALTLKVAVVPDSNSFTKTGNAYKAKTTILKYASGARTDADADAIWEAGNLTVVLRNIEHDDLVMIIVTDLESNTWQSDFFSPLCPKIALA